MINCFLSSFFRYCLAFAVIRTELRCVQCTVEASDSNGPGLNHEYVSEKCDGSASYDFGESRPLNARQGSLLQATKAVPYSQGHSGRESISSGRNKVWDKSDRGQSKVWDSFAKDWDDGVTIHHVGNASQVFTNFTMHKFLSKVSKVPPSLVTLVRGLSQGRRSREVLSLAIIALLVVTILVVFIYLANEGKAASRDSMALLPRYAPMQQALVQRRSEGRIPQTSSGSRTPIAAQCRHLCPGLVVPSNNECFLAVPAVKIAPSQKQAKLNEFDVKDLKGRPVIRVEIGPAWGHADSTNSLLFTLFVACMPDGTSPRPGSGNLPLLGKCRTFREESGTSSVFAYDHQGELYAHICKDPFRACYTVTSRFMNVQLVFDGNLKEHAVLVTTEQRVVFADTEPRTMSFDPRGEYYQLHLRSNADVALILCGLTAIEHLELF